MLEALAKAYPYLVRAMRRRHGLSADQTAGLILSVKYPERAKVWTAEDCSKARALIVAAVLSRPRVHVGA